MAEIPLVYPNHVYQSRRYVVDGLNRRLSREDAPLYPRTPGTDGGASRSVDDAVPGAASVSELELRGTVYLLTTCAKLDDPEILSISLAASSTTADWTSPRMVELDSRQLELQPLVSVAAFAQEATLIRLVLVDSQGTFVTFFFNDQLIPLETPARVARCTDYISDLAVLQGITGSELQSTMIAFANSTTAIIGLSPFLMTVDLDKNTGYLWSETQCLEDMKARSSSFGSLLTNFSDILLGRLNEGVMDMSPTAALCIASTPNPLLDATYCITLHSDTSLRKWKIDLSASPVPMEVHTLDTTKLPLSSKWSDSRNSVALCSRTYDQTYAVCVHIKTEGFLADQGSPSVEALPKDDSDCHLWVLYGDNQAGTRDNCMPLKVPKEALSLVGMSFSPTSTRCSLDVLFEAKDREHNRISTMHLNYPPSIMSIVSSEPKIEGKGSLDKVASQERSRIRSLLFGPTLMGQMEDSTVEAILHELDSCYLKFLFRPMFPRGNGTVLPPPSDCIRRALAKLVHGYSRTKTSGMSIELELVRTIYEWRRRDLRQMVVAMTPVRQPTSSSSRAAAESPTIIPDPSLPATQYSVYDAFVQDDETDDEEMEYHDDDKVDEEWQKVDQERSADIEAHEKRWRRFLLQVWEEEQVNRTPLQVKWLSSQPLQVIVRSGLTAIIDLHPQSPAGHSSNVAENLDRYALNLLDRIEKDTLCSSRLYKVEQHLATIIGKAQLALEPLGETFVQDLTAIARSALFDGDDQTDGEHDRLHDILSQLSPSQLLHWVQSLPGNLTGTLPGLEILGSKTTDTSGRTWSQKQVANHQVRHSACTLAIRCVDSVRRLQLSRSLLLLEMVEGSQARDAALRAYLHALAVLWTSSQRVPMPPTAFQTRKPIHLGETSPDATSPPNKRLSFGDDATSILSPLTSTMTTSIDVLLIEISQTMADTCQVPLSPMGMHIFLTRSYIRLAFSSRGDVAIGKPSLLPELGALPRPKDDTIATDYPRLALRLLVPYVAYPLAIDSADVVLSRKESLAQCLLIESHTAPAGPTQVRMREIACELLVPENKTYDNVVEQRMIRTAFEVLESMRQISNDAQASKDKLSNTLKSLVPSGTSIEIARLCELETVTKMFSPVDVESWSALDQVAQDSVKLLAAAMLRLSRVMNRLSILERHLSLKESKTESQSPDVLLAAISNAISELTKAFPEEVCQGMPEYGKLWTRLFHHSVLSGQWKTAYNACVRNPNLEHRESSFRRLVRSMVDQGALGELLVLCTELGQRRKSSLTAADAREAVDLYEMASEILVQAVSRDIYSIRAASSDPASFSDYQGSLYALHVSQKHWRRAAQSMDLRYVNAQKALGSRGKGFDYNLQLVDLRDCLIVEDLALASVGALNAIELVKDHAHRFLVSGEYGSYHKIPLGPSVEGTSSNAMESSKRSRNQSGVLAEEKLNDEEDRLANFMTTVELAGRAVRTLSLRALFFDRSSDTSLAKSAFLRPIDSAKLDVETLFQFGYFNYGLLLAKAWTNNRQVETASSRPGGSDLFFDCICHMIETYLIPVTSAPSKEAQRPTFEQLLFALDSVHSMESFPSYVVPERYGSIKNLHIAAMKMSAMSLIRKLTLTYTSATSPVALEVASSWLESGSRSLPAWLEQFLMGSGIDSPTGLFAPRPHPSYEAYMGDPISLMNLYTKHGLLAEACSVVSTTLGSLDGADNSRESRAASRLPEKGDIDYFPHKSVDMLWNLIDIVLSKHVLGASEEKKVRIARDVMKESLTTYFSLLKLSESGMRSARALQK